LRERTYLLLPFLLIIVVLSTLVPGFSTSTTTTTNCSSTSNCNASSTTTSNTPCVAGPSPSLTSTGAYTDYPTSIAYQSYTYVSTDTSAFTTPKIPSGPAAISVGVYNGVLNVQVEQSGTELLSTNITGGRFYDNENYVVVHGATSLCYVNFDSNGDSLSIFISAVSGQPLVAYNVYNNYISANTADLITYPRQFYAAILPSSPPLNTGLSFLVVAPKYSEPTPLAIWVGEGSGDPTTGQEWWAQVGLVTWVGNYDASYAFMEMFSNIPTVENCSTCNTSGPAISNYQLIPGDTYNFTMAVVSGTTWEFSVNGTAIQGGNFKGFYDTGTSDANNDAGVVVSGGSYLGLETLASWGGNVGITDLITIPVMSSFRVGGRWSEPTSFAFNSVGENWGYQATSSPGIDLWGIAGHMQQSSVPCGTLLFGDSLPRIMQLSESDSEPLYACSSSATTVAPSPSPASVGKSVALTATVVNDSGLSTAPTGQVAWSVNGSSIGSCTLNSSGSCTISYTPSSPGQYAVSALYLGDSNYVGSTGTSTLTIAAGSAASSSPTQ